MGSCSTSLQVWRKVACMQIGGSSMALCKTLFFEKSIAALLSKSKFGVPQKDQEEQVVFVLLLSIQIGGSSGRDMFRGFLVHKKRP